MYVSNLANYICIIVILNCLLLKQINSVRMRINAAIGCDSSVADIGPEQMFQIQEESRLRMLQYVQHY